MNELPSIRRALKATRKSLPKATQAKYSRQIIRHIYHHLPFQKALHIGSYLATGGEVDLKGLPLKPHQRVYWPILREFERPWQGRGLLFASGNELRPNTYGIPEPQDNPRIKPCELDYLLIPLVAFDRRGNRIGMGGGYYDRALAGLRQYRKTFKLGVAYGFQEIQTIEPRPWDIPLDGIVTEKELIPVRNYKPMA